MNFSAELFLAWRYFKPKRNAVSVITLISVIGVALGVCVLIVVLAVMTGFTDRMKEKLLETGAHGQLRKMMITSERHPDGAAGRFSMDEAQAIIRMLKSKGAVEAAPVLISPALLQVGESFYPKFLMAFEPGLDIRQFPVRAAVERAKQETARYRLHGDVDAGQYSLNAKEVLISTVMANEFRLGAGKKIILHTPPRLMNLLKRDEVGRLTFNDEAEKYIPAEFTISGIFTFDKYDFDKDMIFMQLDEADDLFNLDWGDSTHIFFWVKDPFNMKMTDEAIREEIRNNPYLANNVIYYSWKDMNKQMLDVLQVEKSMMFFLLIFIVLVAAFSITNTLITTVIQKTKEIGLLKSMGTSSWSILRIFVLQGAFVGLVGSLTGVLLGWLIVRYRMAILEGMRLVTGMEIFPKQMYFFSELPAHIIWSDVVLITIISILLCTLGAVLPALRAAKLDPARALRYE